MPSINCDKCKQKLKVTTAALKEYNKGKEFQCICGNKLSKSKKRKLRAFTIYKDW